MRYESFYPFSHHPAPPTNQQRFLPNTARPFERLEPNAEQQFDALPNHMRTEQGGQGPSKLDHYMQTADRFLTTAQQFAPLVQQFAPMISNLPSMWRLYKGFQSMPDRDPASESRPSSRATQSFSQQRNPQQRAVSRTPQQSTPKIFQPPNP